MPGREKKVVVMANIKDIARLANVSIATVSRVFNNKPDVSEKTRAKVLEIARQLGYEPSIPARSLIKGKTNTLGLIVPDISNPYYAEIVRGIEDTCHAHKYNVILCNADNKREKELLYIDILKGHCVDGVVFHSDYFGTEHYKAFKKRELPVVLAGRATSYEVAYVAIDNCQAAYEAVNYLIALGHQKIGVIHGPLYGMRKFSDSAERLKGYRKALKEAGLKVYEELLAEANFTPKGGYEASKRLLSSPLKPTAIFAFSDLMALGALKAVLESGLKCPDDISILGFDNLELTEISWPSLTTVAQPRYEIGARAASTLIRIIQGRPINTKQVVLSHKLIIRDSCRRI